jgi:hypothetical protein
LGIPAGDLAYREQFKIRAGDSGLGSFQSRLYWEESKIEPDLVGE